MNKIERYYEIISCETGRVVAIATNSHLPESEHNKFPFNYAEISKDDYDQYATGQIELGSLPKGKQIRSGQMATKTLEDLIVILRPYLAMGSTDGPSKRQEMRNEMRQLIAKFDLAS